ncbi:MAG: lysine--tRNA ligase [Candidatus Shapirobacteria bacterium]
MAQKRLAEIRKERIKKLRELRDFGINPYPSFYPKKYSCLEAGKRLGKSAQAAGRVKAIRRHGQITFADLMDESGQIQLWFQQDLLKRSYSLVDLLDVGDFLGARGQVVKTKAGEISLEVESFEILAKTLKSLPEKRSGLKDEETRFRQRYLELAIDPELRELFRKKALFWQTIRNFLLKKGFLEVETPVLENITGGADADPFITHHNALDIDLYLRISMGELWQKRLLVGGFEKTFELGRQFRNEGVSFEHLQDYTQMEFYWAYVNYLSGMELVEEMYKEVVKKVFGKTKFDIGKFSVDFGRKWEKIDYVSRIEKELGIDVLKAGKKEIQQKLKSLRVDFDNHERKGRLIDKLWKQIRVKIAGPAFLVDHPVEVSPLAKRKKENPALVERFQVILAGSEMGNGYSELNDPIDQKERFEEQAAMRKEGDKEAQMADTDFVEALEYGMPPACGFGVSERLFCFLVDRPARECVFFPLLRPKK